MSSISIKSNLLGRSKQHNIQLLSATALATVLLFGCGTPQTGNASEKPASSKKSSVPVKAKTKTEFGGGKGIVKQTGTHMKKMNKQEQEFFARKDLAERLNLKMDETNVSGSIQVTWRSGALGCPQPGMSYTQALVPGALIMVKVGNKPYRYHASRGGEPFYCPDSQAESQYLNSSDI